MPKPTFENLPARKRDRFIDAAVKEFSDRPYDQASVSRVVADLGIAKGSVYQYFDDKLDLFRYLIEQTDRLRDECLARHLVSSCDNFFGWMRSSYAAAVEFMRDHPRRARLAMRLLEPSAEPRLEQLRREQLSAARAVLSRRLSAAREQDQIRDDVDVSIVAAIVEAVGTWALVDALPRRLGVELVDLARRPELASRLRDEDLTAVVDAAMDVVRHGLVAR